MQVSPVSYPPVGRPTQLYAVEAAYLAERHAAALAAALAAAAERIHTQLNPQFTPGQLDYCI